MLARETLGPGTKARFLPTECIRPKTVRPLPAADTPPHSQRPGTARQNTTELRHPAPTDKEQFSKILHVHQLTQDCRSITGLRNNAETTQTRMNKHHDKVMKCALMKCTMVIRQEAFAAAEEPKLWSHAGEWLRRFDNRITPITHISSEGRRENASLTLRRTAAGLQDKRSARKRRYQEKLAQPVTTAGSSRSQAGTDSLPGWR